MSEEHEVPGADDGLQDTVWGDGPLFDPFSTDSFSQELVNIDESDWGDADLFWDDDATGVADPGSDAPEGDLLG
ncbi:hypothetical protein [Microbacterium sp. H1-D42]|uniref:hypothetical protein n=1 Tax=Microbacterium sp. H1-D42 TaxID=2925844 RepID=UPI001F53C1AB|nr:hypothetical protein [Microbacterium sp. H1-D42]UNK70078.1 hypothetical protein MNR00_13025 [Microbacterium sp. H1-D42]